MIEFDETLTTRLTGKMALKKLIETRLKHTTYDIPYYQRGVDTAEFVYGSQVAAIKLAFKDLGPDVQYDAVNSRVQSYNLSFDVSDLSEV